MQLISLEPIHPPSDDGHRFILTLVDYATRYPEAKSLEKIDTETVARALVEIFSRVGFPGEILSDQGKQSTADLMKEIERLLAVKHLTTTPYHPSCNGLVERFNAIENYAQKGKRRTTKTMEPLYTCFTVCISGVRTRKCRFLAVSLTVWPPGKRASYNTKKIMD